MTARVAVVGAAGIIGPGIVATLAEQEAVDEIVCLDRDEAGAREVAERHGGGRARAAALDIRDSDAAARALAGATVLVNSAAYRINLEAMRAAARAGAHYIDLGGLFHVTRQQLELDDEFRRRGLLAVLGMGSTPGKTNVMAARAVELLEGDTPQRIVVAAAGRDPDPPQGPLVAPYALETILDELTMPTPVVRDGQVEFLEPLTDSGTVEFGEPVGPSPTIYTIHSEQATFADSFGASDVSFRLSLNPAFLDRIRFLTQLGLASDEPLTVGGAAVTPRSVLLAALHRLPRTSPSRQAFGVHRIEAHSSRAMVVVECQTHSVDRLGFGGGVLSTACPPAVVADMICRGELNHLSGVLPSERAVPYRPLFERLENYGVSVRESHAGVAPVS
ncbi:MAG: saccharopine dehydrogenase family protein [Gaiellales bacterium]